MKRKQFFLISALVSLLLLVSLDQNRLQPWVYQYSLMLAVFALQNAPTTESDESNQTLGLIQILIAGLYIWSGVQKMNYTFSHETVPFLLAPVQNIFSSIQLPLVPLGIFLALAETLVGAGLLFRKTRVFCVWLALVMHLTILSLLIAQNYNSIVWIWNAALCAAVFVAFWKSDVSVKQTIAAFSEKNWKLRLAQLIIVLSILLPTLNFFGWCDAYLSAALYSGSTETAVIRVNRETLEKLSPSAAAAVFQTQNGEMTVLPFFEWSMAEMNVPVYPERRVFTRAAREVCSLASDKNGVELIIKERPAILDGSYKVARINCAELEK